MTLPDILRRFGGLFCAYWLREGLLGLLLLLLARTNEIAYGQFMLAFTLGHLCRFSSEFGINQQLGQLLGRHREGSRGLILQVSIIKTLLLVVSTALLLLYVLTQDLQAGQRWTLILIAMGISLEALPNSLFVALQVEGEQLAESRIRSISGIAGVGFGLLMLLFSAPLFMLALFKPLETIANTVLAFRAYLQLPGTGRWLDGWRNLVARWQGAWQFVAIAICAILFNKINVLFLQSVSGLSAVAQYSASWMLVDGVSTVVSAMLLGKVIYPMMVKEAVGDATAFSEQMDRLLGILLLSVTVFVVALSVFRGPVIGLLYGDQYAVAQDVQLFLPLCVFFAAAHNFCNYAMMARNDIGALRKYYVFGLLFNVLACSILIPLWGTYGAAWSIVLTKLFMLTMTGGFCYANYSFFRGGYAVAGLVIFVAFVGAYVAPELIF